LLLKRRESIKKSVQNRNIHSVMRRRRRRMIIRIRV
jgi:hypothetical protein